MKMLALDLLSISAMAGFILGNCLLMNAAVFFKLTICTTLCDRYDMINHSVQIVKTPFLSFKNYFFVLNLLAEKRGVLI